MGCAEYDFNLVYGCTGVEKNESGLVFNIKNDGAIAQLTGVDFEFSTSANHGTAIVKRTQDAQIIVDIPAGRVTIPFSAADSTNFLPGTFERYMIKQISGTSVRSILSGKIYTVICNG